MHTIIHIGAGNASELPQMLETGAEQITLVEPNPERAEQLRQRTVQHPQVTVVEAAITTSSANNRLQEYNLPEACSLHPATGLKTLFPGLKVNATHTVPTLSPDKLMAEHGPQSGQRAMLAIQVPGEEHALLETLINTDQLKQFSELRVNANPKPYYQGGVAAENTLQALVDYGYQITGENQQDPDWPSWQLARNPLIDKISTLQAENEQLRTSAHQLEKKQKQSLHEKVEAEKLLAEQRQQAAERGEQLNGLLNHVEKQKADAVEQQRTLEQAKSQLHETVKKLENTREAMTEAQGGYKKAAEALAIEQADHQLTNSALEEKNQQCVSLKPQTEKLQAELEGLKRSTEKLTVDSEGYRQQAEKQQTELTELKTQNEQLKHKLAQGVDKISVLTKELTDVSEKFAAQQAADTKLDDLEKKIASVGSNLTNHLDKKLINAAKQIENTLGLQNYFNTGELPLSHYGWSINPDLALYLTERLETENYDLVIEFGSGNSTVLFAKVLMKKMFKQKQLDVLEHKRLASSNVIPPGQEGLDGNVLHNDAALSSKRVLTFEHNKNYYDQTTSMLRHGGLEQMVNLVHAPLVDFTYSGEDYLYYDCDIALTKIAELYESRAPKILVLVDGPPGETGPNARFPALPKLINHLSTATLDIILDDYNRMEEKAIAESWIELINKRAVSYTEQKIPLTKGAICISIGASVN